MSELLGYTRPWAVIFESGKYYIRKGETFDTFGGTVTAKVERVGGKLVVSNVPRCVVHREPVQAAVSFHFQSPIDLSEWVEVDVVFADNS